ncbi:ATP12 family chaperone protein [Novosphingobium sp. Leaf2]|uniref:ATP12 family chaperone protein n=1 Tax=Novosphingobium sp. Leaf2 TaxID=1735670 RepID=UPI0006FF535B|nr:ATP12 family protein [Novosphingobium sp. Leaf2]KQM19069.1 molecular chaperone [Novosphingobium sp. Leaf2]
MKRFYKTVAVEATDDGWRVTLDGRAVRTAGGRPQVVPTRALAQALADEWDQQGETIAPTTFPYRDLVDFAIDAITPSPQTAVTELLPYAETDTLCYRADPDEALYKRQMAVWEPVLQAAEQRLGVTFVRISGVIHKPQPDATLVALRRELDAADAFQLAALKMLASLSASLVIALEAVRPAADAQGLWQACELEADWQVELWGEDAEAAELRATRFSAFQLAISLAQLSR